MAKRTQSAGEAPSLMSGCLDEVSLPEIVQLLASGNRCVRIGITRTDGRHGEVVLENGQVTECYFSDLFGEEAFFALCRAEGAFTVQRFDPSRSRRVSVSRGWQELVLEAARRLDEERCEASTGENVVRLPVGEGFDSILDVLEPPPAGDEAPALGRPPAKADPEAAPSPPGPEATPADGSDPAEGIDSLDPAHAPEAKGDGGADPLEGEAFERAFAEAMRAYMRRSYDRALELFSRCREMRPHDQRVLANLERLSVRRSR